MAVPAACTGSGRAPHSWHGTHAWGPSRVLTGDDVPLPRRVASPWQALEVRDAGKLQGEGVTQEMADRRVGGAPGEQEGC